MSAASAFTTIPITLADAMARGGVSDVAVYLARSADQGPLLYRQAGFDLPGLDADRLREHGISTLLVRRDNLSTCEQVLEDNLEALLNDADLPSGEKAKIVQHVGVAVARDLLESPGPAVNLARASSLMDNVVAWVLNDPESSAHLLAMVAHHRSTASHMFFVSALAVILGARVFGDDDRALREVGLAGALHDLGKLGIDPELLNKSGPLGLEEKQHIQQHPVESVRLLGTDPQASLAVRQMILQHHERVDGRGYPVGLDGEEMLLGSKILGVVDSFHAMLGRRAYRDPLTANEATRILNYQCGRQFDPEVLACWNELVGQHGFIGYTDIEDQGADDEAHRAQHRYEHCTVAADKQRRARAPRLACDGRAQALCLYAGRLANATGAPDHFVAHLQDLSRGGMCVRLNHPAYRGEIVHVRLRGAAENVWVRGMVAWCRYGFGNAYRAGIRFIQRIGEDQAGEVVHPMSIDNPFVSRLGTGE